MEIDWNETVSVIVPAHWGGILEELDQSTCRPFPSKYPSYLNYLPDYHPHHAWITMETIWNKVMDRLN
eukprot:scaffold30838_cov66-Attheya_sp.AAC.1